MVYHVLVTLGHNTITSYPDFTQRLIERFDRKDPKVHFREPTQLKQTGSADAFISEFQRIAVHDEDVHEEIALEPSCKSSDTSTSDSQILDKLCAGSDNLFSALYFLLQIFHTFTFFSPGFKYQHLP